MQPSAFQKVVQGIGYDFLLDTETGKEKQEEVQRSNYQSLKNRVIAAAVLTFSVVVIGMFFMDIPYGNYYMWALTMPVLFVFGKNLRIGMDLSRRVNLLFKRSFNLIRFFNTFTSTSITEDAI